MTLLTVVDIVLLTAVLAGYLYWVGSLLGRIAANLEDCAEKVREINAHAEAIVPGVEHINRTGGVVAGALPLLYGMAEQIVTEPPAGERGPARPASGTRRSRLHEMVGFTPR